jgi:starch synthase
MVPIYVKHAYSDDPHFKDAKLVYSFYGPKENGSISKKISAKLQFDGIPEESTNVASEGSINGLHKLAIKHSDAVVFGSSEVEEELKQYTAEIDVPTLEKPDDEVMGKVYSEFYDKIMEAAEVA